MDHAYEKGLDEITLLAEQRKIVEIADILELPVGLVKLSLECVGDSRRKGTIKIGDDDVKITNFAHQVRVAFAVKYFYPKDVRGRKIALVHDTKEEAQEGQEDKFRESGMVHEIELLTEVEVSFREIEVIKVTVPEGFDSAYVAKYRKFIRTLHDNWGIIGHMELCDRLDQASSYSYLLNPKYHNRLKFKALESFGRMWATINIDSGVVSELIKEKSRAWFDKFGITEEEVEEASKMFV